VSGAEKAFKAIRAVLNFQERMDGLDGKLGELSGRLARLADSHVALRDRVSRIEGIIEGVATARAAQPRIEAP
jgi:hypothetical protein